jgi:hypothetical protein
MDKLLMDMITDACKSLYAEMKVAPIKGGWNNLTSTKVPSTYDVVKKYKAIFGTIQALADSFGNDNIKDMVKQASATLPETESENVLGLEGGE